MQNQRSREFGSEDGRRRGGMRGGRETARTHGCAVERDGGDAEVFIANADQQLAVLEARLAMVADQAAAYQAASLRVSTLRTEHAAREQELRRLQLQLTANVQNQQDDLAEHGVRCRAQRDDLPRRLADATGQLAANDDTLQTDLQAIVTEFAALRADIDERIANNRQRLAEADTIRAAVTALQVADELRRTMVEARADHQRRLDAATEHLHAVERQLQQLDTVAAELTRAQRDAELIDRVPFGATCADASCQFVTSAVVARDRIVDLQRQLASRPDLEAQRVTTGEQIAAQRRAVQQQDAALRALDEARAADQKVAAKIDTVAAAEARIAELTQQRDGLDPAYTTRVQASHAAHERRAGELAGQVADLSGQLQALDVTEGDGVARIHKRHADRADELQAALAGVDQTRDRLAADLLAAERDLADTTEGNHQAITIQQDLTVLRRRRDDAVATVARAQAEATALRARAEDLARKADEHARLVEKITTLDRELIEWQQLEKAFGRDGLIPLEIDAAGPTVSSHANALLAVAYGTRFTVDLVTQQAKADGKGMREDFTIKIYDNERGGDPRDITDLSGGEKVIVAEALMNAIAIYVNQRSPMPVRTCWRDETTAALYPEVIPNYIAMLRKVQELGGFHHIFYVTHSDVAAQLADVQIQVGGGAARVVFHPFAEAA